MTVELFDINDADRMREALAIRTQVFVEEQGVPPEEEIDAHDRITPDAVHALARDATGRSVGAARYYPLDRRSVQIGRMAVAVEARGIGAGRALLETLCAEARRRGFVRAHLHAQLQAREFYAKAGFEDDGEPLWDAGILHRPMSKRLA